MTFKFNYETSKGIKQVILTNCGQAPFKRFSILGNSHQDSTTGKQLFKLTDNYLHAYFYHGENKEIVPYSVGLSSLAKIIDTTSETSCAAILSANFQNAP